MPIKMELTINKSTNHLEAPFEASITFIADSKPRAGFILGRSSIMEAAMEEVVKMLADMAPNATQAELDDYYRRWDKVPPI